MTALWSDHESFIQSAEELSPEQRDVLLSGDPRRILDYALTEEPAPSGVYPFWFIFPI